MQAGYSGLSDDNLRLDTDLKDIDDPQVKIFSAESALDDVGRDESGPDVDSNLS